MQLEALINKATDATLTSDNWQYILDVCDKVSSDPEDGTKEAIRCVSSKLTLKDANIILRATTLLLALAENCGSRMQQQIASKSFLLTYLVKRMDDKKLHRIVKLRIAEIVKQLHESFANDSSLKPMTDAYNEILRAHPSYLKKSEDILAPNKPAKETLSHTDKAQEDQELQRVLKLSLEEYEREKNVQKAHLELKSQLSANERLDKGKITAENPEQKAISNVSKVRALYDLVSYEPDELSFRKGDIITVIESVYRDWWRGTLASGKSGIFPLNYVTPMVSKSDRALKAEVEAEDRALGEELRKVDKLLAILSSNPNSLDEDEITQLYNEIISLRPLLGTSIDKYSMRKEELLVMNLQLSQQIKLYNEAADRSISRKVTPDTHSTFGLPYPAPYPSDFQGRRFSDQNIRNPSAQPKPVASPFLQQQTTSYGFGNDAVQTTAYGRPPSGPEDRESRNYAGIGRISESGQESHFLNVDRFPVVNDL